MIDETAEEYEIQRAQQKLVANRKAMNSTADQPIGEFTGDALAALASKQERSIDGFARRAGVQVPLHPSGDFATRISAATAAMTEIRKEIPHERFVEASERRAEKNRRGRIGLAMKRGVPDDSGVLAVASAEATPSGEAVALLSGILERREGIQGPEHGRKAGVPACGAIIVVLGDVNTGKTAAAARLVARHPRDALYIRASSLPPPDGTFDQVSFDRQAAVEKQQQLIRAADLVVIDEIGVETYPWWVSEWCCLRWPNKVTVLLGNTTGKDFLERYQDPRFHSRLLDRQDQRVLPRGMGLFVLKTKGSMHRLPLP